MLSIFEPHSPAADYRTIQAMRRLREKEERDLREEEVNRRQERLDAWDRARKIHEAELAEKAEKARLAHEADLAARAEQEAEARRTAREERFEDLAEAVRTKASVSVADELTTPSEVDKLLADARQAWIERQAATFNHPMTEELSAFILSVIDSRIEVAKRNLEYAEKRGHHEDADFAHETVAWLTAEQAALRAGRLKMGWSEDGDEAPEA